MTQTAGTIKPSISQAPAKGPFIAPLQNGDHLTRAEFERRYDATPNLKKAELIEGKVYMAPAVSAKGHGIPHFHLAAVFGTYSAATPWTFGSDNSSVRLDLDNMPQPDLFLVIQPTHGGVTKIDQDDYVACAPDLVAEIAATSASYDLHEKLRVYRRSGVREYLVWRTLEAQIDYFILRDGEYRPLPPAADGSLHSEIFPGLWIDAPALLAGDLAKALALVQQGVASPEHAAFVEALRAKANR